MEGRRRKAGEKMSEVVNAAINIPQNSKVSLYSGVEISTYRELAFSSRKNQEAYYAKREIFSDIMADKNFSYLRRTGEIKIDISMLQAKNIDFISFINPSFENERIYARMLAYRYVSVGCTAILYAVDYFQSYMFDVSYLSSIILREHLSVEDKAKVDANPFDPTVKKMRTAEPDIQSLVSKDNEDFYIKNDELDSRMFDFPQRGGGSMEIWCIADFDTSVYEPSDLKEKFYDKFDYYITSDGKYYADGFLSGQVPVKVGRGFGIYSFVLGSEKWQNRHKEGEVFDWITAQNLSSNLINNYQTGFAMFRIFSHVNDDPIVDNGVHLALTPYIPEVRHKKLCLFPYNYLRVMNNEGDIKEYRYEEFSMLRGGSGGFNMAYIPMIDSMPSAVMMPIGYRYSGFNMEERIDCSQFPQIGYTTSAYKSFVAAQMCEAISKKKNTAIENARQYAAKMFNSANEQADFVAGQKPNESGSQGTTSRYDAGNLSFSAFRKQAGNAFRYANDIIGAGTNFLFDIADKGVAGAAKDISLDNYNYDVINYRAGGANPTYYFDWAKDAFAADDYHPGVSTGSIGYYLNDQIAPGTMTLVKACLDDEHLAIGEAYFDRYGMSYGEYAVPLICNFIKGNKIDSMLPTFWEVDGMPMTYVKTNGMNVVFRDETISSSIAAMFDSGIQFINGDGR